MAKIIDSFEKYYAKDRKTWRKWLDKNHKKIPGIWLVYYKKDSGKSRVAYADAVEEALCYGWIDSTVRPGNEEFYMQLFTPRKPKSGWSKLNKQRIDKLIADDQVKEAGLKAIATAKQNGSWEKLDGIEALEMPAELKKALNANKAAKKYFESLGPSTRKYMIYWIATAKLPETRARRVNELIEAASANKNPAHFTRPIKK
jgi:uncharacterized protein YdeI (YjbR/CyaY-like superfamily)